MPAGDPADVRHYQPPAANSVLDAEETDRTAVTPEGVVTIKRQRSADPEAHELLAAVRDGRDEQHQRLDYYDVGSGVFEIRYLGLAPQGTATDDPIWTIRRMSHTMFGGTPKITDVQTLTGSWDDRASLSWS
jgi:hypothetical protein